MPKHNETPEEKVKTYRPLYFFNTVPTNSLEKKLYHNMSEHNALPFGERISKEIFAGAALAITKIPISVGLVYFEKKLYPPHTPLGIPAHNWENQSFCRYGKFGAPIIEEFLFRGILLSSLHARFTQDLGMKDTQAATASSVVNSLAFSAIHTKGARLHTFFGGMLYSAMTYYCDGSLVPAITAHGTINTIAISSRSRRMRR